MDSLGPRAARGAGLVLVWFLAALVGCATSPTGRRQLLMVPEAEMDAMGVAAFDQIAQQTPQATDAEQVAYVTCVAEAIVRALPRSAKPYDWEVLVFADDTPNAFALPGGKIGVHTGLLEIAENQDQLAAVVAHEVAHVLANHGNERMSQQQLASTTMDLVGAVTDPGSPTGSLLLGAMGIGAQYGVLMPYKP